MIDATVLSTQESQAIGCMLRYWTAHWDWECPTLFGMELTELCAVADAWPVVENRPHAEAAVIGAMREFLWGASAVPKHTVLAECGLSYTEAGALLQRLSSGSEQNGGNHGQAA